MGDGEERKAKTKKRAEIVLPRLSAADSPAGGRRLEVGNG